MQKEEEKAGKDETGRKREGGKGSKIGDGMVVLLYLRLFKT